MRDSRSAAAANAGIREEAVEIPVSDGSRMRGYWASPSAKAQAAGLLLFQEAFGVNAHIRDVARRFAAQGYSVLAPELFHRSAKPGEEFSYADFNAVIPHMKAMSDKSHEEDIRAAHAWLSDPSRSGSRGIAAVGYCMGGRTAFLAAAIAPLKAAVSYYGGGIAPMEMMGNPGLLDRAGSLKAPVLLYWGGLDQHIKAADRRRVADALEKAGKPYAWTVFSGADHGFFCDARANYNAGAAAQSWALTLEFLKGALG